MTRPKKNSSSPTAKDRMVDAFWLSLETYRIDEVTVSMITSIANCNRGSFYYHFDSLNELARSAFKRDCMNGPSAARVIYALISGKHKAAARVIFDSRRQRKMSLIGERGGNVVAGEETCAALNSVWIAVACSEGEACSPGARAAVDFVNFGVARFISTSNQVKPEDRDKEAGAAFLRDLAFFAIQEIARFQGIGQEEALARLKRLAEGEDEAVALDSAS